MRCRCHRAILGEVRCGVQLLATRAQHYADSCTVATVDRVQDLAGGALQQHGVEADQN